MASRRRSFILLAGLGVIALVFIISRYPGNQSPAGNPEIQSSRKVQAIETSLSDGADSLASSSLPRDPELETFSLPGQRTDLKRSGSIPVDPRQRARERRSPNRNDVSELINTALYSMESSDREDAVNDLGFLPASSETVTACIQALHDSEASVRLEAVVALQAIQDPSAIPALQERARDDPSSQVREAAKEAIAELLE